MSTKTGFGDHWGYRYGLLGSLLPRELNEDRAVGALDAPTCIAAGSHRSADWRPRTPHVTAHTRRGVPVAVAVVDLGFNATSHRPPSGGPVD